MVFYWHKDLVCHPIYHVIFFHEVVTLEVLRYCFEGRTLFLPLTQRPGERYMWNVTVWPAVLNNTTAAPATVAGEYIVEPSHCTDADTPSWITTNYDVPYNVDCPRVVPITSFMHSLTPEKYLRKFNLTCRDCSCKFTPNGCCYTLLQATNSFSR